MTAPTTVVLFGATGDLAKRKLIPGLLHLFQSGLVDDMRVVGTSLDEMSPDDFRDLALVAIREHSTREVLELRFGSERNTTVAAELQGIGERLEPLPDRILIYAQDGEAALEQVVLRGLRPITTLVRRSSLEDVFLRLTGRTLVE